jgi:hypothetical protein
MPHKKSLKRKTHRRKHRGGYYGFTGAVGAGAPMWGRGSEMGQFAAEKGMQYGRGRRTRKGKGKGRKHRGGGKFGGVSASFGGTGSRGIANYEGVITRTPVGSSSEGKFNNFADAAPRGSSFVRI